MDNFFAIIFFASFIALGIGLINPKWVIRWGNKRTRGRVLLVYGLTMFGSMISLGATSSERKEEKNVTVAQTESEKEASVTPQTIGISYNQAMENFSSFFTTMEKITPINGQDRYLGRSADEIAILEIIGDKDNISQATLVLFVSDSTQDIIIRICGIVYIFLKNTVPEWKNGLDWTKTILQRSTNSQNLEYKEEKIIKGDRKIEMTVNKILGSVSLTIKHI